jgi:hypothetical protein
MQETKPIAEGRCVWRRAMLGMAILIGIVVVSMGMWSNGPGPRATFDEGEMELLGVTQGMMHVCPKAYPWERAADRLPSILLKWLPASGYPAGIPARQPSTRVWLALSHAPPSSTQWHLIADTTNAMAVESGAKDLRTYRGRQIFQVDFEAWPRNARSYRLEARRQLDRHWAPDPLGTIEVKMPRSRATAPLAGMPIPVTNAVPNETWRVAIDGFDYGWVGAGLGGIPRLETNLVPADGAMRARMLSEDPADRGWFLICVRRATNAAGDVLKPQPRNWGSRRPGLMFTPGPWPGEAWNLLLEFSRNG